MSISQWHLAALFGGSISLVALLGNFGQSFKYETVSVRFKDPVRIAL